VPQGSGPPVWAWFVLAVLIVAIVPGVLRKQGGLCAADPSPLANAIRAVAREQAAGLRGARTELIRAYEYEGPSQYWKLTPRERMVAVEAIFVDAQLGFDLDDVDFVDADTGANYGSDPLIQGVDSSGRLLDLSDPARPVSEFHVLLARPLPTSVRRVILS
jgi:hypothetical protein